MVNWFDGLPFRRKTTNMAVAVSIIGYHFSEKELIKKKVLIFILEPARLLGACKLGSRARMDSSSLTLKKKVIFRRKFVMVSRSLYAQSLVDLHTQSELQSIEQVEAFGEVAPEKKKMEVRLVTDREGIRRCVPHFPEAEIRPSPTCWKR